jgi:hypothetical protein
LPSGHFRLLLPDEPDMAVFTAGYQLDLSELELTFVSSADSLVVHLTQGSKDVRLPARACLQTLLLLAEIRARSNAESGGWIGTSELAAMRACTPEKIAVDIHRLRKLLEEAGVHGAARIVERDDTKKLRIGIERTRQIRL